MTVRFKIPVHRFDGNGLYTMMIEVFNLPPGKLRWALEAAQEDKTTQFPAITFYVSEREFVDFLIRREKMGLPHRWVEMEVTLYKAPPNQEYAVYSKEGKPAGAYGVYATKLHEQETPRNRAYCKTCGHPVFDRC